MLNFLSPRGRISRAPYALAMLVILLLLAATVFVPALGWVRAAYEDGRTRFSEYLAGVVQQHMTHRASSDQSQRRGSGSAIE